MKICTFKRELRKSLNLLSCKFLLLNDKEKEFYVTCAGLSYLVVEPIIGTDIDMLSKLQRLSLKYS